MTWKQHELDFLENNYQYMTCGEIGKKIGKTKKAVQHKFNQLNLKKESNKPNSVLIGEKYHRLTILNKPYSINVGKTGKIKWKVNVVCDCGKIKDVWLNSILNQQTKSCGCYSKEMAANRARKRNQKYTNGITNHKLYKVWRKFKDKYDHKFICSEWVDDYENFYNWAIKYWRDGFILTRRDIDRIYSPENCIFIPKKESKFFQSYTGAAEKEIISWLSSINLDFKKDNQVLEGKEIDIYNKDLKIGIEYCGLYWHNEKFDRNRQYHYDKYKKAKSLGIRLITLFSDEWIYRNKQVKGFLLSMLQKNYVKVFARKCEIKEIDAKSAMKFINENHIQSVRTKALIYFGLIYNNELVGVTSLKLHHRTNKDLVLDRMCFKYNHSVIGGASRMFKCCIKWAKDNCYNNIISWSDNRWSIGNVYEKLGFVLLDELKPDYSYVDINKPNKRKSKQSMKKSNTGCPANITEKAWCKEKDYYRIWDCGKKRWVYYI